MNTFDFPTQYEPYQTLRIGTNTLTNVKALASIGNDIPLLVGKGATPRVWLSIPMDQYGKSWYPLIKDNFATHPDVIIEAKPKLLIVRIPNNTVLTAIRSSDDTLTIQKLDLRPFGINIYADEGSLHVMGNTLTRNEFRDIQVVIGVGTTA